MPAIRDFTTSFTSVSTGTTIVFDTPVVQTNDLLLAAICSDTGPAAWTPPSGWTQLLDQTNTSELTVFYKIATSSEPSNYTFTRASSESFSGGVVSIMDVDTTNPFGNPAVFTNTTQAAASRFAMSTITTNRNDALVIYVANNSSQNGSPTFIEGNVNYLFTVQGISESIGLGWGFQKTAGTTPTIYCISPTTGAGVKATIQIAPPASGATVIPTYTPADSSIFVDPIDGTTAYNSNTGFANTATTYFGTTLGGLTLANATVAAQTDYGINPVHSVGAATTSAAGNWSGATTVLASANYVNISGKNVLVHTGPPTPLQYQSLASAAAGKGIAFGMASATNGTNFKVWHVSGAGTSFLANRNVPCIINSGNTTGVIGSNGTFDPTSVKVFGYFVSSVGSTSQEQFYMVWVLDTITIAGGNATNPVTLTSTVLAIQGHEHRGAIIQGANQGLFLMPVQFGNGGTNPIYLKLDNTAIEFPTQYNKSAKKVNYCSTDNVAGITYYAGPSDTIIHTNSVISSESPYKWGLHASSSTSATYNFSGLSVIGAGQITLNKAITVSEITINKYQTLDISNLTLNNSTIINPPDSNNSITLNSSTTLNGCNISVTTLSAGNYLLSTATPNQFSNCSFNGSASSGHAIRITAPGTYSFSGNTFTGFGADGTTSAAIFNDSGGLVTLNITGGGNTPTVRNGTGASTIINNAVTLTVTVKDEAGSPIQNARVSIQKTTTNSMAGAVAYTGSYTDETTAANNSTANDMTLMRSSPQVNDAYYFGGKEPFYKLTLNIGTAGAGTWTITWEYYNGSTWAAIPDVYDPTNGFRAGTGNFNIVFSPPYDWASTTVSSIPAYWIRARVSSFTSQITQPKGTQAWVYLQIMNKTTDTNGQASETYNYSSDEDVNIIIRKSSTGSTRYYPVVTTQTITISGLNLTWILVQDTIAST